jgi:hypothetical protein
VRAANLAFSYAQLGLRGMALIVFGHRPERRQPDGSTRRNGFATCFKRGGAGGKQPGYHRAL